MTSHKLTPRKTEQLNNQGKGKKKLALREGWWCHFEQTALLKYHPFFFFFFHFRPPLFHKENDNPRQADTD